MNYEDLVAHLRARRQLFLHFRWLLVIWLGACAAWLHVQGQNQASTFCVLVAMLATQAALWLLPLKAYEGLKVFYAIFLLDLNFMLLGFWYTGQMQPDLMVALFLGTFVAALARRLSYALLGSVMLAAVYHALKSREPGFEWGSTPELLKLPFLFIASAHSGLLAQEAASESAAMRLLAADREDLSDKLKTTFVQIARYNRNLSGLIDALPFGIVMLDKAGRVTLFNEMAEYTWGLGRQAVLDHPLASVEGISYLEPLIQRGVANPESDFHLIDIKNSDGKPFQMNLSTYPVRDGKDQDLGVLAVFSSLSYHESVLDHIEAIKNDPQASQEIAALLAPKLSFPNLKPNQPLAQAA